jgi:hypothetical protein
MIGAALAFDDPTVLGLPRERGILTPMDAKCIDAFGRPREGCSRRLSLVGALGTPWNFSEDFLFSGVLREKLKAPA